MIKELRSKFIKTCMLSAVLAIVLLVGAINVFNFSDVISNANDMINLIVDNNGMLPKPEKNQEPPPKIPGDFTREAMFEVRHFVVVLDENNEVIFSDTNNIYYITSEKAEEYAVDIIENNKEVGFIDSYKYKETIINGYKAVIFLDCSADFQIAREFLMNSIMISIVALGLILIVSYILSSIAIKPIIESYDKQKKFITNASHEIKTPLTVIGANTDILEMSIGESKWIDSTKLQINRLTELVNNLVSLARMDENNNIEKEKINLSEICEMIDESYDSVALEQKKNLESKIQSNIIYEGNEKNISQLIYILMDNAFKYSNENGEVELNLFKQGNKTFIEVYNTIDNIEKGEHKEFFDRFYRKDESHNSDIKGYGIGLSLAKSIVEAHKGKIKAISKDGKSVLIQVIL